MKSRKAHYLHHLKTFSNRRVKKELAFNYSFELETSEEENNLFQPDASAQVLDFPTTDANIFENVQYGPMPNPEWQLKSLKHKRLLEVCVSL